MQEVEISFILATGSLFFGLLLQEEKGVKKENLILKYFFLNNKMVYIRK